jgi:WD40 repeat protein
MLTVGQEHSPLIEVDVGSGVRAVTFTANGEHLVSGCGDGLLVWGVEDGTQTATMAARDVRSLAVSQDGRWITAGTCDGYALVWDATTFENVFTDREDVDDIFGVDFSPDSTRLVTASRSRTATVWDLATHKKVLTLNHLQWVIAAKYSPQGDRIATATRDFVQVWDSNDGRSFKQIPIKVTPWFNTGLLWSNNHLFVVSDSTIKQLEASTGSTISEWPVPDTNNSSCIALPHQGEFIAYSTNDTVTFWDTSTHTSVGLIQHTQSIRSIALSPDDRFLAIGGHGGKVAIKDLRDVLPASYSTVSIVYCRIIAYQNRFTAYLPSFNFSSTCKLITLSLSYHSLASLSLHSIPGSRNGSQTRKHH